jgi:putative NADPH-quinone reductase
MRVLVIYCHPDKASFAGAVHQAVTEGLAASGHAVTDLDLYGDGFSPIFTLQDRSKYFDTAAYFKSVEPYASQLAHAEGLVVIYPAWWYGMPAMLKGYFDRVWAPGVAYDVKPGGKIDTSRLAHLRRIAVVTTYGGPWWFVRLVMGDPARKLFNRGIRNLCAHGCTLDWHAHYNMDRAPRKQLQRFLAHVKRRMVRW